MQRTLVTKVSNDKSAALQAKVYKDKKNPNLYTFKVTNRTKDTVWYSRSMSTVENFWDIILPNGQVIYANKSSLSRGDVVYLPPKKSHEETFDLKAYLGLSKRYVATETGWYRFVWQVPRWGIQTPPFEFYFDHKQAKRDLGLDDGAPPTEPRRPQRPNFLARFYSRVFLKREWLYVSKKERYNGWPYWGRAKVYRLPKSPNTYIFRMTNRSKKEQYCDSTLYSNTSYINIENTNNEYINTTNKGIRHGPGIDQWLKHGASREWQLDIAQLILEGIEKQGEDKAQPPYHVIWYGPNAGFQFDYIMSDLDEPSE